MAVLYTPRFSYGTSETAVPTDLYTAPTDVPAVYSGSYGPWDGMGGWVGRGNTHPDSTPRTSH